MTAVLKLYCVMKMSLQSIKLQKKEKNKKDYMNAGNCPAVFVLGLDKNGSCSPVSWLTEAILHARLLLEKQTQESKQISL